jgi:hypothetical protein
MRPEKQWNLISVRRVGSSMIRSNGSSASVARLTSSVSGRDDGPHSEGTIFSRELMATEKQGLEARRERRDLPAIDKEMLASIVDNFEKVTAEGPNPKKKHLLHQLVKKVLIHSRQTVEIWYALPNSRRFEDCNIWLPGCANMRTRPGRVALEVYLRIGPVAIRARDGYREQTIEIAMGP